MWVPQKNKRETAEETESLSVCLKIFKNIGVDVRDTDIDIAHSSDKKPNRPEKTTKQRNCIQVVRRMVRERVVAARANTNRLTPNDFDLPSDSQIDRLGILSHLPPELQDQLRSAKSHQTKYGYKYR